MVWRCDRPFFLQTSAASCAAHCVGSFTLLRITNAPWAAFLVGLSVVFAAGCSSDPTDSESASDHGQNRGIVLLRCIPGSESSEQREAGFLETLESEFPDLLVISSNQYAGATAETALEKAQQLLLRLGDRTTGIFCPNESSADGTFRALDEAGYLRRISFVGFDPNPRMVAALEAGTMQGIVLQDPVRMGYLAVKTMAAHLDGKTVESCISTGQYLATPDNMHTEQMQRLLSPKLFSGDDFDPSDVKYTIAVIPKGTTHEFWKSVHYGVRQAAEELGNVAIFWKGPISEGDREGQINLVQDFITRGVDGICLAPLDSQALLPVVKEARSEGIPTVIFDSDLADDGTEKVSYVATDNYAGGALGARRLAEVIAQQASAR